MATALKGRDTPEYKAVKQKFNQIAKLSQHSLIGLAAELFANDLLTDIEYGAARNKNHLAFDRALEVITIIMNLIESDTSYFSKFIAALKESDLTQAVSELEGSLAPASSAQSSKWDVYVVLKFTAKTLKIRLITLQQRS